MSFRTINPEELGAPKGFSHGLLAPEGARLLFVAGQNAAHGEGGVDPEIRTNFVRQFEIALGRVLAVVRKAGGEPDHVARMTIFVTDMAGYLASRGKLGAVYREAMGRHYPAMALVEVNELVDRGAVVEIEATAVIPKESTGG